MTRGVAQAVSQYTPIFVKTQGTGMTNDEVKALAEAEMKRQQAAREWAALVAECAARGDA